MSTEYREEEVIEKEGSKELIKKRELIRVNNCIALLPFCL